MSSRKWLILTLAAMVLACGCSTFNTNLTTQTNSSSITFITPAAIHAGSQPDGLPCPTTGTCFTLTVNGGTFIQGAEIQLTNAAGVITVFPTCSGTATGTACTVPACASLTAPECTTFVSSSELQATLSAADVATAGTAQIAVRIPGSAVAGASGSSSSTTTELSNIVLFNINSASGTPPAITSLAPPNIGAGSATFQLTISGTNFAIGSNPAVAYWIVPGGLGTALTTVGTGTATSITVQIPDCYVTATGTANVSVSNAAAGGGVSSAKTFTITSGASTGTGQCVTGHALPSSSEDHSLTAGAGTTPDGRYVVYAMASLDGITERPGMTQHIFVRDTCLGAVDCTPATSLVSVSTSGQPGDAASASPSISADGRYVAFLSFADNLIAGDANGAADVFVRDTCAGAPMAIAGHSGCTPSTQRVSVASDGTPANFASESAAISSTGRYVTFRSQATNLAPGASAGATGFSGIFVRDTCAGTDSSCTPSTQLLALQN